MFSLLSRGGSVATTSLARVRHLAAFMLTVTLVSAGVTASSTALHSDDSLFDRAFGGYSDIKLVRAFQLPTT